MKPSRIFFVFLILIVFLVLGCGKPQDSQVVERKEFEKKTITEPEKDVVEEPVEEAVETPEKETPPDPEIKEPEKTTEVKKVPVKEPEKVIPKPVKEPEPEPEPVVKREITVKPTSIEKQDDTYYKVVLNNQIEIYDVMIREDETVVFPFSVSNDKRYYFVWFDDTDAMRFVKDSIVDQKVYPDAEPLKITGVDFKSVEKNTLKGYGKVQFNDTFWINSFPLFVGGKYKDGIAMPSVKEGDEYVDKIKILDKDLKSRMEQMIIQKYNEQK